jgi:hypothetical protein
VTTAGLAETIAPRMILARERNRKVLEATRNQTRKNLDKPECDVCKFEVALGYSSRGTGYIYCHGDQQDNSPIAIAARVQNDQVIERRTFIIGLTAVAC